MANRTALRANGIPEATSRVAMKQGTLQVPQRSIWLAEINPAEEAP
jgi:hypothetical protein